jgi:hypothetical protein
MPRAYANHRPYNSTCHTWPYLDLTLFAASCVLLAAKMVSCPVLVVNSGNRKLRGIDAGSSADCSHSAELLPGQNYTCMVTR